MKTSKILPVIFLVILVGCTPETPVTTMTPIPSPTLTPSPTPIPQIETTVKQNTFLFSCSEKNPFTSIPIKQETNIVMRGKVKEMGIVSEYDGQETECATIPMRDLNIMTSNLQELPTSDFTSIKYGNALEEITSDNAKYLGEILSIGKGTIQKVAFSPNGKYLAITTFFGVYLYSGNTFDFVRFIKTPTGFIGFSKDGNLLYTVSNLYESKKSVQVWDLADGSLKEAISLATSVIRSFSVSPDGKMFLTAGDNGVTIWSAENGRLVKNLIRTSQASYAEFSHSGGLIAVGLTGKVQMFEIGGTLKWENELSYKISPTIGLIFSPDDQTIEVLSYTSSSPGKTIYQASDGSGGKEDFRFGFAYSPKGRYIAVNLSTAVLLEVLDTTSEKSFNLDDFGWVTDQNWVSTLGDLVDLVFSPDENTLVSTSGDGSIQIWDMETQSLKTRIDGFSKRVVELDISMDGSTIAYSETDSGNYDDRGRNINLYDVWSGSSILLPEDLHGFVFDLQYFPNNQYLAASVQSDDWTKVQILNYLLALDTNEIMETYISSSYDVGDINISGDNTIMVTNLGPNANRVDVWKIGKTNRPIEQLKLSLPIKDRDENAISFDGTILAYEDSFNSENKFKYEIKFYDVSQKKDLGEISFPFGTGSFEFLPDSNKIIMVFADWEGGGEVIQFLDPTTLSKYSTTKLDIGWNQKNIALSPSGRLLALTTWANEIKVFNIDGGIRLLFTLRGHAKQINEIAFSQDRRFLVSGGEDGVIKLWAVMP